MSVASWFSGRYHWDVEPPRQFVCIECCLVMKIEWLWSAVNSTHSVLKLSAQARQTVEAQLHFPSQLAHRRENVVKP